ncbi:MAG: NAD-dependent epimerase/dehydratase family protein [Pyrinomonadaceae bacterium]
MKVLVTGGSGYLGTHVRRHFAADDYSRRGSSRDVLSLQDAKAVGEYDVVIHMAAAMSKDPSDADEVFLTNVEGTVNILREVRPDAAFIFASMRDVYGRFADNYREVPESCPTLYAGQSALEWSKLVAERYVEYYAHTRRFRSCIFRMSAVYAPLTEGTVPNFVTHYADSINKGEPIALPDEGRPRRDILHVDDFSAACEAFVDSGLRHGLYNIGGGAANALSLIDLVRKLEEVSGLEAIISPAQPPRPVPFGYVTDLTLISRELGWTPRISLEEGLRTLF